MAQLTPPGNAWLTPCPDCQCLPVPDPECSECDGTGQVLYRVCPGCGDTGWYFVNEVTDAAGMYCLVCGARWAKDHPEWVVQHHPQRAA